MWTGDRRAGLINQERIMSGVLSDVESVHTTLIPTDTQSTGSEIVLIFFNLLSFHMVFYFDCIVGRADSLADRWSRSFFRKQNNKKLFLGTTSRAAGTIH